MKAQDRKFENALAAGCLISRSRKTTGVKSIAMQAGQISAILLIFCDNLIPMTSENAPPSECPTNNGRCDFSL